MDAFIKKERYQDAGMAKNFDFENVIMGSSMSQNFRVNEYKELFGGETIKLTMEGSASIDWTFVLDDLIHREIHPKTVLINLDPYTYRTPTDTPSHELPTYLYDFDYLNDVNYWFNFQIYNDFTVESVIRNIKHDLPDINEAYVWTPFKQIGTEYALGYYQRPEVSEDVVDDVQYSQLALDNMRVLTPYIDSMPDSHFVFFCSPFSMLYWDTQMRNNSVEAHKQAYLSAIGELIDRDNVSVYLWNDEEMLEIISNLDNYADEAHYSEEVNSMILKRIVNNQGLLTKDNFHAEVDKLFDYIENYDYEKLFT